MAVHRPLPSRQGRRRRGRPRQPGHLLLRRLLRRRLEDRGRRHQLAQRLRRLLQRGLRRRGRRVRLRPQRHIRRNRRVLHPPERLPRRRRVQVHRRRRHLAQRRPGAHPPHRPRASPPPEPGPCLRRRVRPRLRTQPRARRLPLKDGGETWELVLHKSDRAGAVDISMDANNPRILYAAIYQAQRYPWIHESGGEDSGLYKSTDGGDTWENISSRPGMPEGIMGRIGVAASPARPGRVWALIESSNGGLFRSDDGGNNWELLTDTGDIRGRPWYYTHIFADPQDAETVYALEFSAWRSIDGGRNFSLLPTPARRQPRPLDRPQQPPADDRGQRRRRLRHLQRRPFLVVHLQPAHRPVLPRRHRRPVPLPRLRRPAGQPHDVCPQPLAGRRHRRRRAVPGGRRRGRFRSGQPGELQHRLQRPQRKHPTHPLRPQHRPGQGRGPVARGLPRHGSHRPQVPLRLDRAHRHLPARPEDGLHHRQPHLPHSQRGR